MGASMRARMVYKRANTAFDVVAARATIRVLTDDIPIEELVKIVEEYDIVPFDDPETLRHTTQTRLDFLIEQFVDSMHNFSDVTAHQLTGGVWMYITGGQTWGEAPTESYDMWDILLSDDALPEDWQTEIGRALGLLMPVGDRSDTTVEFVRW